LKGNNLFMKPNFVFINEGNRAELTAAFASTSSQKTRTVTDLVDPTKTSLESYQQGSNVGAFMSVNSTGNNGQAIVKQDTGETFTGIQLYMGPGRYARNMSTSDPEVKAKFAVLHPGQVVKIAGPYKTNRLTKVRSIRVLSVEALVVNEAGARAWVEVDPTWDAPTKTPAAEVQPDSVATVTTEAATVVA
jgi:hypothetical protein